MNRLVLVSTVSAAVVLALTGAVSGTAAPRAELLRTIHFSALDSKGVPITDLTAADLAVKEGGKDRPIESVKPATAPMQVSMLVDDAGTGAFQFAVSQFLQALFGRTKFAISVLNPQPMKIVDFIEDAEGLKAALGKLGQRGRLSVDGDQIIDAVAEAAKELRKREATRPVIVVLSVSGETPLSDRADPTLKELRDSGASLNVLHLTGIQLGKVLGDGPRQSGGLIEQASTGLAVGPALAKIADSLLHQYVLTYNLPDGVKMNERLTVSTTRKGVTLVAPNRVPEK